MHKIKGYKDEWRIQEYLLITFFISWLCWGVLVTLSALGIAKLDSVVGMILFVIGGFGPTISAILCLEGKLSFRKVWHFITDHKAKTIGYFLLFVVLMIIAVALPSREVQPEMPWFILPVIFLICALLGGGNEELGWRGTMQPILERAMSKRIKNTVLSFIVATLIVGVVWALWHLPLWFVDGSTQQSLNFGLFTLNTICLSFWFACVYRYTGSVLYCMILHGLMNLLESYFILKVNWLLFLCYAAVTIIAIVLASRTRPAQPRIEE